MPGSFDETKHKRDHGRFAHSAGLVAAGAVAGAAGGALLTGGLLRRRLIGVGLHRGVEVVGQAAHAASDAVHHIADQITHRDPQLERRLAMMRHPAHGASPVAAARNYDPVIGRKAQELSRGHRGHGFGPKRRSGSEGLKEQAAKAYADRRELAARVREHRRQNMGKFVTMAAEVELLEKFVDTQPRDDHGRFADAGVQRRTLHKLPSYYRMAGRVARGGKADADQELPVGSFLRAEMTLHEPKALPEEQRKALERGLVSIIIREREATIARGQELLRGRNHGLIPEGTPKRTINRAYNHAAMIALHKYGIRHYDFAMDDHLKAEMTPLVPFMRYAQRRMLNTMLAEHKGGWKPYRAEFGVAFKDKRKDADGNVRLRVKPLQVLIKAAPFGELSKAFDETKHKRDHGRFTAGAQVIGGAAGGLVAAAGAGAALHDTIQRGGKIVGNRKGAAFRLQGRKFGLGTIAHHHPDFQGVLRDQSRLVARIAGNGWARRMGLGVTLGAGMLGNYAGDFLGRKAAGATEQEDNYDTSVPGLALSTVGLIAGHKLASPLLRRLGKSSDATGLAKFDETKHPREHGKFASKGSSDNLVQPAQMLGGFAAGTALAHVAARPATRAFDHLSQAAGRAASRGFLNNAHAAQAVSTAASKQLLQHQASSIQRIATSGTRFGLHAGLGVAAATVGDIAGDWAARRLTGAKGKDDEYRHLSLLGLAGGTAGMIAGQHHGSSRLWRSLRNRPLRRGVIGTGLGMLGGMVGEVAGNLLDEKTHTTDLLAGTDRKTVVRFADTHARA